MMKRLAKNTLLTTLRNLFQRKQLKSGNWRPKRGNYLRMIVTNIDSRVQRPRKKSGIDLVRSWPNEGTRIRTISREITISMKSNHLMLTTTTSSTLRRGSETWSKSGPNPSTALKKGTRTITRSYASTTTRSWSASTSLSTLPWSKTGSWGPRASGLRYSNLPAWVPSQRLWTKSPSLKDRANNLQPNRKVKSLSTQARPWVER